MWRSCGCFLLLGLALACGNSPSEPAPGVSFTTLAAASIAGAAGPQIQTVVRDQASWARVWTQLWGHREIALPPVDFSRDMVVVVTGTEICFGRAEIEEILHAGGAILIRYADAGPTLCLCAIAELNFHAVRAPRAFGEARFERRVTPPLCPSGS